MQPSTMNVPHTARGLLAALATAALSTAAFGQANPLPSRDVARSIDTGYVANPTGQTQTVIAFHVYEHGAAWMRLHFDEIELAYGATLKITSLLDGHHQLLNEETSKQWQNTSAYFNGDLILVEVIAPPYAGPSRLLLERATLGLIPPQYSICGVDDRVLSNNAATARLLPIGCTGFIIDDACGCFVTAGHCSGGSSTAQFNVPLSNSNGSLNHPPPADQYAVDQSSKQSNGGQGVGNDYAYFGVFPNSNTGLTPRQAQGADFTFAAPPAWNSSLQVRITGYGTDGGTRNQVQQTEVGPWLSYSPSSTRLSYVTDTTGGNSGSPIIQEEAGVAMGVHTHGGCNPPNVGNNGTASTHPGLQNYLANPKGVCQKTTCGTVATTTFRNGSGVNPACLQSLTAPVLGSTWQIQVDATPFPTATRTVVQARTMGTSGIFLNAGELLLDLTSFLIFQTGIAGGGVNVHTVPVPTNLELVGRTFTIQGVIASGEAIVQLCNAEDAVLGCMAP